MTDAERQRVDWHLRVPACRIMAGARRHLSLISCEDLRLLCRWSGCSVSEIEAAFRSNVKAARIRSMVLTTMDQVQHKYRKIIEKLACDSAGTLEVLDERLSDCTLDEIRTLMKVLRCNVESLPRKLFRAEVMKDRRKRKR